MEPTCSKLQVFFFLVFFAVGNQVSCFSLSSMVHKMGIINQAQDNQNERHGHGVSTWLGHHKVLDYLRNIDGTSELLSSGPKLLRYFRWNTCDQSPSILNLTSLNVSPDPLRFPGDLYLQFAGILKETVDAPLQLKTMLKKEVTPNVWIHIPCIEGLGSCQYYDMCSTLQGATCPMPFVKYAVPCKCPFSKGSYKMQKSQFKVDVDGIPLGNYYLKASVNYGKTLVTCLEIHFTIHPIIPMHGAILVK